MRVQGVSGDIGSEDVEGNTDGVGGGVNVEDEVWAWGGLSHGVGDDVYEDLVKECRSWESGVYIYKIYHSFGDKF